MYLLNTFYCAITVCYNPFIYCWLNETFRRKTNSLFTVFKACQNCCGWLFSCCSWAKSACTSANTESITSQVQLHLNTRSGSGDSVDSNSPDDESPITTEKGLTISNGTKKSPNKQNCPELAIEMASALEMSECDG